MRLTIQSDGEDPDDKLISFTLVAETDTHKTTLQFYDYADAFQKFSQELLRFPFESKKDVTFRDGKRYSSSGTAVLRVTLLDNAGRIEMIVDTDDEWGNKALFGDDTIETEALHRLARTLQHTDFTKPTSVIWES